MGLLQKRLNNARSFILHFIPGFVEFLVDVVGDKHVAEYAEADNFFVAIDLKDGELEKQVIFSLNSIFNYFGDNH